MLNKKLNVTQQRFFFSHILILKAELCADKALLSDAQGAPLKAHTPEDNVAGAQHGLSPCRKPCVKKGGFDLALGMLTYTPSHLLVLTNCPSYIMI